jgi:hypothetical protein
MGTRFRPGHETCVAGESPKTSFSGVFEDNGETAYFYACDRANTEMPILDGVHIYNVADLIDGHLDSEVEIRWSADGLKAGLLINEYLYAVLDFATQKAYSRSNFPPVCGAWSITGGRPSWHDGLADLLR